MNTMTIFLFCILAMLIGVAVFLYFIGKKKKRNKKDKRSKKYGGVSVHIPSNFKAGRE
jgi:putative copper export protein